MIKSAPLLLCLLAFVAPAIATPVKTQLWRLDCGAILLKDYGAVSGDPAEPHAPRQLTSSCYLIQHGTDYMEWEAGVDTAFIDHPENKAMTYTTLDRGKTLVEQFRVLGIDPRAVRYLGLSHLHTDHMGQAALFSNATLLMGERDLEQLRTLRPALRPDLLTPWLTGNGKVIAVTTDYDIFGDGSVVMLDTPGHTLGHHSLLVRLASGPVLLSGDLWHFHADIDKDIASPVEADAKALVASRGRIRRLLTETGAKLIVQHDPLDIAKLPPFPEPAR